MGKSLVVSYSTTEFSKIELCTGNLKQQINDKYELKPSSCYLVKSCASSEEKIQFATAAQSTICVRIILSTSTAIICILWKTIHTESV